jgi:O-succinylbenzoate synthase
VRFTRIRLYHLRMELRSPFETSFGRIRMRDAILLEAMGEGITAYGECVADRDPGFSYETTTTAWHILRDFLIPAILDRELVDAKDLQRCMAFVRGHPMAKAGLEMVLWDMQGKLEGHSLRHLLGGVREAVEVGVSVGIQESPESLVDVVQNYVEQGYQRIKIKIKPGQEIAETRAVRQAFPDLRLQVDANSAYTLETAAALAPLDELDLLLIEQPLAEDDLWDHSKLQAQLSTPLCLDESILSPRHARQALEIGACRIINLKAGRVGGLSQALDIHNLCWGRDVPVWCGGMLETGVGRAANLALASLPGFTLPGDISATDRYYADDITHQRFTLNPGSTIDVPEKPGLGVSIDRRALEKATIAQLSLP